MKNLEDVFKRSGIPTHTFVEPPEYNELLVSIRTPGRGTIVEGPSGIGKTTSVQRILELLPDGEKSVILSGRNPDDYDLIIGLRELGDVGFVIIDDFHRLPDQTKFMLADYIKLLADTENKDSKIIIVGINKAGQSLINYAADLMGRIDTIRFESNPESKIRELIDKGEAALNVQINIKEEIIQEAQGSFHLCQMLCHEACVEARIIEEKAEIQVTTNSMELIRERVLRDLAQVFYSKAKLFATGPRLRKEGRAPYFYLLYWLATGREWTLNILDALNQYPEHRGSIMQIVDKGYLTDHITRNTELEDIIHFDQGTKELSIEDPKFVYYLRNLLWSKFSEKLGYCSISFDTRYDYALSFAGTDRNVAEDIFNCLVDHELHVFYDRNEQHRILAENVEDYLAPIYKSEASFVVVLIGRDYPNRIWTKFESDQFKERFGENSIIPVWFSDNPPGMFDESAKVGGVTFDREADYIGEISRISDLLCQKISECKENNR